MAIKEIMTRKVISVSPETSLMKAADILSRNYLRGLPVVTAEGRVVGLLTEHDFITKGSAMHLPTLLKLIGHLDIYWKDKDLIRKDIKNMFSLRVADVMEKNPPILPQDASVEDLLAIFNQYHGVSPILITDQSSRLAGVVSRY